MDISADKVLEILKQGNQDHIQGIYKSHNFALLRKENTQGQHPIATVLSCSDSRVPVEHIFQQGLGDLFVIRVAGNVANVDEIASAEYGTVHLNTPLLIILGHSSCGAITAVAQGGELDGHLGALLAPIKPVVEEVRADIDSKDLSEEELINKAAIANVFKGLEILLTESKDIKKLVSEQKLKIVGAYYHLNSGEVSWLGEHPKQVELLK